MKLLIPILILLGIADSGYLLYANLQPYCPLNACEVLSVPFLPSYAPALFGLLWFAVAIPLFLWKDKLALPFALWRYTGIAGITFLGTYALLNLYFCPYCIAAYLLGISLVFLSEK
jgi:uncharacterized membrane protein